MLCGRVVLMALVAIGGIVGMLLAEGAWDWLFLTLASLPLLIGGSALAARKLRGAIPDSRDDYPARGS